MQEEPGDCHQPHNPARTGSEPTENTTGESKVNLPVFPVYHFLVSAAILVFVVISGGHTIATTVTGWLYGYSYYAL